MKKKVVLIDLDGTLLPMNSKLFDELYLDNFAEYLSRYGYDKSKLLDIITNSIESIVKNNGTYTNEEVFFNYLKRFFDKDIIKDKSNINDFYNDYFDNIKVSCGFIKEADEVVKAIKNKGYRLVLSTNPVFPAVAIEKRIEWAGLDKNDFEIITSYENYHYAKPNSKYFQEIIDNLGVTAEDCIMIGNDMIEDICASEIGIDMFFVTHSLINNDNKDISLYPNGGLLDVLNYLNNFK